VLYLCVAELRLTSYKIKIFGGAHNCFYGVFMPPPAVDSASNRNEYQEHFLGEKAARA